MMEKTQFNFEQPKDVVIEVDGQEIKVKPFLDLNQQIGLINSYLETYFQSSEKDVLMDKWNVTGAENALKLATVDLCSSIAIEGAFENLFYLSTYELIEEQIVNYWEFREILDEVVSNVKEQITQKKSVGGIIDNLYEKGKVILDQLVESTKNLTPEQLEKLKETGKELVDKIAQNPLVGEVFKDAERGK